METSIEVKQFGTVINLTSVAYGNPKPNHRWFNAREFPVQSDNNVITSVYSAKIHDETDLGSYTCNVSFSIDDGYVIVFRITTKGNNVLLIFYCMF
jgi:hypothetical protein